MVQITPRTHRQTLGDPPRRHHRLRPQVRRLRFPIRTGLRLAGCGGKVHEKTYLELVTWLVIKDGKTD